MDNDKIQRKTAGIMAAIKGYYSSKTTKRPGRSRTRNHKRKVWQ